MNSSIRERLGQLASQPIEVPRDGKTILRLVVVLLVVANLAAALMLFQPWGATAEELAQTLITLRRQQKGTEDEVDRLRQIVEKVERAREEGDGFMREYFLERRTASSTILSELKEAAAEANLKQEVHTFQEDPIEGSDTISMMTISGNYEGTYANLVKFVHLLDKSPRFLILDTLTAAPERNAGTLNVNFAINVFVIDDPTRQNSSQEPVAEEAAKEPEPDPEAEAEEPVEAAGEENVAG